MKVCHGKKRDAGKKMFTFDTTSDASFMKEVKSLAEQNFRRMSNP